MGFIYEYLKAVLWGAEEKSQTEENQGFGKDVEAWKEKKHRQDLADGLLGELKKKFENYKTDLKENNNLKKEKCEQKGKWGKIWCRLTASIAYGVKLTTAYVIHRLKLTLHLIVYSLTVAVAWLLIWVFFLVHWPLRIILVNSLLIVFAVVLFSIVCLVYLGLEGLKDLIINTADAFLKPPMLLFLDLTLDVTLALAIVNSILSQFGVPDYQALISYIKSFVGGFIKSLFPPKIKIREGLKETKDMIEDTTRDVSSSSRSLLLSLLISALVAIVAHVVNGNGNGNEDTGIVPNNIYVNIEIGKSVPKNPSGNGGDKPITTWMQFPSEARADDWVKGEYEKDCLDSRASKNDDNQDSKNGDPDPCAVKPDKDLDKSGFLPILKKLSAYGNPDNKVELKILGFSSSSGLLSLKGNKGLKDEVEKKVKKGGKESCYERTNSNQTNVDENLRLSNAFNLCIAELRARNVAKMLEEIIVSDETIPDHIKVIPHKWGSYSEMCRHRGFCDTKKEGGTRCYDTDLGSKNRRAEIRAMALSGCISCCPTNGIHACEAAAQIPPDSRGKTCGQSASPVVCSRNPDITNQP